MHLVTDSPMGCLHYTEKLSYSHLGSHIQHFLICICCRLQVKFKSDCALLSPAVCDSDWSQIEPTEESKWVLPLATTTDQSKSTVQLAVIHYRVLAKACPINAEHTSSQILTKPSACVSTKLCCLMSLPVHWLWCIWHLCAGVLWFRRWVWGVRSHRRRAQGDFHPKYHSGSLTIFKLSHVIMSYVGKDEWISFWLLTLQDDPGVVTCMDNQPHGLQTGQSVVFREVNGMEELNGTARPVSGIMSTLQIMVSVYYVIVYKVVPEHLL